MSGTGNDLPRRTYSTKLGVTNRINRDGIENTSTTLSQLKNDIDDPSSDAQCALKFGLCTESDLNTRTNIQKRFFADESQSTSDKKHKNSHKESSATSNSNTSNASNSSNTSNNNNSSKQKIADAKSHAYCESNEELLKYLIYELKREKNVKSGKLLIRPYPPLSNDTAFFEYMTSLNFIEKTTSNVFFFELTHLESIPTLLNRWEKCLEKFPQNSLKRVIQAEDAEKLKKKTKQPEFVTRQRAHTMDPSSTTKITIDPIVTDFPSLNVQSSANLTSTLSINIDAFVTVYEGIQPSSSSDSSNWRTRRSLSSESPRTYDSEIERFSPAPSPLNRQSSYDENDRKRSAPSPATIDVTDRLANMRVENVVHPTMNQPKSIPKPIPNSTHSRSFQNLNAQIPEITELTKSALNAAGLDTEVKKSDLQDDASTILDDNSLHEIGDDVDINALSPTSISENYNSNILPSTRIDSKFPSFPDSSSTVPGNMYGNGLAHIDFSSIHITNRSLKPQNDGLPRRTVKISNEVEVKLAPTVLTRAHTYDVRREPITPARDNISLSQNDAPNELYNTPCQAIIKLTSGLQYDWATTEKACQHTCNYLHQKYEGASRAASNQNDLSTSAFQVVGHPDDPNSDMPKTRLVRCHTDSNLVDWNQNIQSGRNNIVPLFHADRPTMGIDFKNAGSSSLINNDFSMESTLRRFNESSSLSKTMSFDFGPNGSSRNSSQDSYKTCYEDLHRNPAKDKKNLASSQQKWRRMSTGYRLPKTNLDTSMESQHENGLEIDTRRNSTSSSSSTNTFYNRLSFGSNVSLSPASGSNYRSSSNCRLRYNTILNGNNDNGMNLDSNPAEDVSDSEYVDVDYGSLSPIHSNRIAANTSTSTLRTVKYNNIHEHFDDVKDLRERNFRVNIVGGTYQTSFQGMYPVISPPTSSHKRVVGVRYYSGDKALTVRIFLPKTSTEKIINFDSNWRWIMAKPVGYIIFRTNVMQFDPKKPEVGYFTLQHPEEWEVTAGPLNRGNQHIDRLIDHNATSTNMSYMSGQSGRTLNNTTISSNNLHEDENVMNISHSETSGIMNEGLDNSVLTQMEQSVISHTSAEHIDQDMSSESLPLLHDDISIDPSGATAIVSSNLADWNNLQVMSLVFEYIIDIKAMYPNRKMKKSNTSTNIINSSINNNIYSEHVVENKFECSWLFVSKMWRLAALTHYAAFHSQFANIQKMDHGQFTNYMTRFNWGKKLGEGACKKVYCVQDTKNRDAGIYAISLIDIIDMKARDMTEAIQEELEISMICSSLFSLNICPNLVRVHSMFSCSFRPDSIWEQTLPPIIGPTDTRLINWPAQNNSKMNKELYQYVRMEYCTGGDLDQLISDTRMIPVETVRNYFFQMLYSMYTCREQLSMRHYDIKLLNFLVTSATTLMSKNPKNGVHPSFLSNTRKMMNTCSRHENRFVHLYIGFGQYKYHLKLDVSKNDLVKLTDFGTSVIGSRGLGDPITMQQFTTLENTPIEFFLLGSDARQAYSADTFCLGLSLLHLGTGHEPYESLLKDVYCPKYLADALHKYWSTRSPSSPFYVIKEVIDSLVPDDEENACSYDYKGMVMYHTLYRYMVLFGNCEDFLSIGCEVYADNPIWNLLVVILDLNCNHGTLKAKPKKLPLNANLKSACRMQYQNDLKNWSVTTGEQQIMKTCRERLKELNALKLLERLVHFDPSRRITLHEALQSQMFKSLREDDDTNLSVFDDPNDNLGLANHPIINASDKVYYMHYYRSENKCGLDSLPMI